MKILFPIIPVLLYITAAHSGNAYVGKIVIDGQIVGRSSNVIIGTGIKETIKRKVAPFSSMVIDGGFDVNYWHGSPDLTIMGEENIIKHVLSSVTNNVLRLSTDSSYSSSLPIVINIHSQSIQEISLDGTGTVKLNNIETDQLTINVAGTVDILATGKAKTLQLNIEGTGDVMAKGLESDKASIELDGTGDVEVTVHAELDANILGVGNILYFGSPLKVSKQVSGVGYIEAGE